MCNGVEAPLIQGLHAYPFEHVEMYQSVGWAFCELWQSMMVAAAQSFQWPGRDEEQAVAGELARAIKVLMPTMV